LVALTLRWPAPGFPREIATVPVVTASVADVVDVYWAKVPMPARAPAVPSAARDSRSFLDSLGFFTWMISFGRRCGSDTAVASG
jgi:hypothetical protein